MPGYTVIINGVPIQAETAADAIELTRQAAAEGLDSGKPAARFDAANLAGSRWTEQRIKAFFSRIGAQQRKLIEALIESPDGLTDAMLLDRLGLPNGQALAGVFTGLFKNARKVGADPKDLYQRKTVSIGGERKYEYTLSDSFRGAASKWKP